MAKKNLTHDTYIKVAAPFAQPILNHLREIVHKGCPEVVESIKWGFPHFEHKGILCSMAAFKKHCAFSFWKRSLMGDPANVMALNERTAMGHFERITSLSDLPPDKILIACVREAKKLNDDDVKIQRQKKPDEKKMAIPPYFLNALKKSKAAHNTFESFSYSNKKDYVEWIEEAKTEATREKRLETMLQWLAEGKIRNWKYVTRKYPLLSQ